ncbi:MAG: SdpI family protein [Candidatus Eiseniibacteriota bacterium]
MKITWRTEFPIWILLAAMFVAAALAWPVAPSQIPVHWGVDGQVDRYGGKFEGLLLAPLIALVAYLVLVFAPRLDPARANYEKFAGAYAILRLAVVAFVAALYGLMHAAMRGHSVDMTRMGAILTGAFLAVIGAVVGQVQPNWFVGIRTPWTLSSKTSWEKTHRAASWVLTVGGVLLAAGGVARSTPAIVAAFVALLVGMLGTVAYSYLVWRDAPDRTHPGGTA